MAAGGVVFGEGRRGLFKRRSTENRRGLALETVDGSFRVN